MVGAYRIIEKLGQGGSGHVYKAERGGRFYAVKFLDTLELNGWARREITAMLRLALDNVVQFKTFDRWPDVEMGYPCIVMEFVPGLPLNLWVSRYNPSTRAVLIVFLKIVKALREVFRRGVLHRDIKESNIIIREEDGEPVLIDFGFSSVVGALTETVPGLVPPGTPEYRSPEAMNFLAGKTQEDTYEYGLSDELWAVGVTLYWLLTNVLPFGTREELGLNARIRLETPQAPHVINPRVPEVVSNLCMRMLEKDARARFRDYDELCAEVEARLAAAKGEASWDVPLIEADQPRRGRWPVEVGPEAEPAEAAPVGAAEAPAGAHVDGAAPHGAPGVRRGLAGPGRLSPVGPWWLGQLKRPLLALVAGLAVVSLAVMALAVGYRGEWRQPALAPEVAPAPMPPPAASAPGGQTARATSVREVAQPGNPPEAEKVAAPVRAQPPAPSRTAMPRKEEARSKPEEKPAPQPRNKALRCVPIPQWVCTTAGVCSIVFTGCPGAQVRPVSEPVQCPAGWRKTHEKFDIYLRSIGGAVLSGYEGENTERATVREGPTTVLLTDIGDLPRGTLLFGTLQLGENRFFGTFTQAQVPGGETYPVCLVIGRDVVGGLPDGSECPAGLGECFAPESRPGNRKMFTRFHVYEKGGFF
ncbi:serine/threonine-protein kinase [Archangium sp.]|uniref:serine/threonine protein kinase n=1 Tax=Archangium sp. TaxID=1872627 RepID=UPI002D6A3C4E|nr:serine/threonine-protein kinase [Archangium sp.]HYO51180.1 serine/threonine-protein kinase [Archangium sp.]